MIIVENISEIFCNFILIDGIYECSKCGSKISFSDSHEPPMVPCRSPLQQTAENIPSAIKEIIPNASTELIEKRYLICMSCEFLQNHTCAKCGCSITRDRNYMNKLSNPNETCPIEKW